MTLSGHGPERGVFHRGFEDENRHMETPATAAALPGRRPVGDSLWFAVRSPVAL